MVVMNNFQNIFDKLPNSSCINLPAFKETCLKIIYENDATENGFISQPLMPFANSEVFNANICYWRRLTALHENCKTVYEVIFDITDSNFTFKAGDTIGVIAQNWDTEVNFILKHLDLEAKADTPYILSADRSQKGGKIPPHVPAKSTLRHFLTFCVDIRSVTKKLFLLALSRSTKDENERRILEYLCSKEGSGAYESHILSRNVCVLDILRAFKSCKPNIEVLMTYLPRLFPRPYSVVNTGLKDNKKIKICFSVINMDNDRKGLTTGWLEDMIINKKIDLENDLKELSITNICKNKCFGNVPIYIRKNVSEFSLPLNFEDALILIGTGTGVAPFIGFLEEIELNKDNNPKISFGDVYLFFGCRNPKLDYIYEEELNGFLSRGVLTKLYTTFSRVDGAEKYVQDSVMENGEDVAKLIGNGASVFVCGDLKQMAVQVRETLVKCIETYHSKTRDEAEKLICDMVKEKRYHVDTWV